MAKEKRTKEQLIQENKNLRKRVDELERTLERLKRARESLIESEEKYRSLVESTDNSIYVVDREFKYLFMNKKHQMRLGIRGGSYKGKPYGSFHSPEETETFSEKAAEVFLSGESIQYQHRSQRNGQYFLRTLSPIKGAKGSIIAVTIVSKDINELKRAEFERDKIIFELQDAMAQIKTLKGLVPICAWCKKIRDDKGYWQQLETYVRRHSEVDFTHGICEDCLTRFETEETPG